MVFACAHVSDRFAHNDDLRLGVSRRFQKHRVHIDHGGKSRRLRLCDLRAPHLAPVKGDIGVQRHILRFERNNAPPLLPKDAAERRCEYALSHMGTRPHQHDALCHQIASASFLMFTGIPQVTR